MVKPKMCPVRGAVAFFEREGGYSYDANSTARNPRAAGRKRSARNLAVAECVMEREGAEVRWVDDQDAWSSDPERYAEANEVLCADLVRNGRVVQSLCGIDDPTRAYARVVEAELASEEFAAEIAPILRQVNERRGKPVRLDGRRKPLTRRRRSK
jgi:hypothetical protein